MLKILGISCLIVMASCKDAKKSEALEETVAEVSTPIVKEADTTKMVYFKGGKITIGSNNGPVNEQPTFEMEIAPFYLDKNLVTVAEFREFINQTKHKTEADTFGDSGVFMIDEGKWTLLPGANWEYPLGKDQPKAQDNHPVTQVSWNDAKAYASWAGKRLPTEFEWEYAAKNGENTSDKYAWGASLVVNGKYMANVWEGTTIQDKTMKDGYLLTSPVGHYGATKAGLNDMGGNVWQWCENYHKPYPESSSTPPADPNVRSTRGGSFMFDEALENSYTTTFRGKNSIDTSLFNMGFRCAK